VEHGHEGTDANLRSTVSWLLALFALMFLSIFVLWWVFKVWASYQPGYEQLPSALYRVPQAPPEPRVLPNPVDSQAHPEEPVYGPPELLAHHRAAEDAALDQYGLRDPSTGAPQLPPGAVAAVLAENRAGTARLGGLAPAPAGRAEAPSGAALGVEPMPSLASGGTRTDNYLK
jgi:hypothetical protein